MASRRNAEIVRMIKPTVNRAARIVTIIPMILPACVVPRRIPEYLDYSRTENGLDVYRDLSTGKEVFIPEQPKK
jgi:hypothetical protein